MRSWEPEPGEQRSGGKPWRAFKIYRDQGPERSLRAVAEHLYGDRWKTGLRIVKRWSAEFEWVERVSGYENWLTMRERAAIEAHMETKAADFARRQLALRERLLENAEKAADQAARILDWPLSNQKIVREDEDGNEVTYVFLPSRWSKGTAKTFQDMAAGAVVGSWMSARPDEDEGEKEYDFSEWTEEELTTYLKLSEKLSVRKRPHD